MINVLYKYGLLLFCLTLFINGFSQFDERQGALKETVHLGAILPHRKVVNELVEGHAFAYEVSYYHSTYGGKDWQEVYNYPKLGISGLYMNFGNAEELGHGFGLLSFIELPMNDKKINWRVKMGYGLGYIQKPFDRETNYKNIAIGSRLNALLYMSNMWHVNLNENLSTSLGVSLIHFSNGSYKKPNLGLNVATISAGFAYHFGALKEKQVSEHNHRQHFWRKQVMLGVGLKEIPPVEGPKYFVSSLSFNGLRSFSEKSSYGVGVDLFYNTALPDLMAIEDDSYNTKGTDKLRFGIVGMYGLDFGRISLLLQMGAYVFNNYDEQGPIYHRVCTRYYVKENAFLNLSLKTHYAVADFIEVGGGISF